MKREMYEDDIEELNKWFVDKERAYSTGFNGEEYIVSEMDVEDFCDFLKKLNPDLVGISCMVGTSGIWFTKDELQKARYL